MKNTCFSLNGSNQSHTCTLIKPYAITSQHKNTQNSANILKTRAHTKKREKQNPISNNHVMHAGEFEITKIERKWCIELIWETKKERHRERGQVSTLQVNLRLCDPPYSCTQNYNIYSISPKRASTNNNNNKSQLMKKNLPVHFKRERARG